MKAIMKSVILMLAIVVMISPAYAQLGNQGFPSIDFDDDVVTQAEIEAAETAFSQPGLLADHPLYFLKRWGEGVRLFFAFDPEEKAKLHLEFAKTRMAEAKRLVDEKKIEKAKESLEEFNKELDALDNSTKGIGKNVSALVKETENALEKSALVLALVLEKVPEQAKPAIEKALNNSIEKKVKIKIELESTTATEEKEEKIMEEVRTETKRNIEIRKQIEEIEEKIEKRTEKREGRVCIQVITPARNPATGEVREFPTPCDVPPGWERLAEEVSSEEEKTEIREKIEVPKPQSPKT